MPPTYGAKWPVYAKQWDKMKIKPHKEEQYQKFATKTLANKARYEKAQMLTGVPWYMIAALHERESSQSFSRQLAQGDPLSSVSTHVPRGRGPFNTWEESAYDALVALKGLNKVIDWRLEKMLYYSEQYNGWGYYNHGLPSAYIWAGTTIQVPGKYIADGVWSDSAVDSQLGIAGMIYTLANLDKSIRLVRETPPGVLDDDEPEPPPKPQPPPEEKKGLFDWLKGILWR